MEGTGSLPGPSSILMVIYWTAMIKFHDLSYTYPGSSLPAIRGVSLHVPAGELCLVIGPSGAGKSTLLRCTNGLIPHFSGGSLQGTIQVDGLDPVRLSPREMSWKVGFVFQDPEAQFVVDCVEDEIAFALENAALPVAEMKTRVAEALMLLGLTALRSRRLETLSGGERQRVAIAAVLALRPHILVLDEPTSQLDPHSAEDVLQALVRLNQQLDLTVLLTEHRLERVLPYAGQVVYLDKEIPGAITGKPRDVLLQVHLNPPLISLGKKLGWTPLPLTVEEAKPFAQEFLDDYASSPKVERAERQLVSKRAGKPFIQALGVVVSYGNLPALRGVDLELYPGEITVLMGPNGAGKTTLLRTIVGLAHLQLGSIQVGGADIAGRSVADICQQVGYLPQDPNALLFADTVRDELLITLRNHQMESPTSILQSSSLLDRLGLTDKAGSYPRDLSVGERQRVALGAVMVACPGALLLDEPTRGLDYDAKHVLLDLLKGWRDEGMAILLVTHDVELAAQVADRVVLLENGQISADGKPQEVLSNSIIFAPQVVKIFPGRGWITVDDVKGDKDADKRRDQSPRP
jgi:energy-coupling factor transport system ATP-binding protein